MVSSFAENPKGFFAVWTLAIIFVICAVGFTRASIKMLEEVKEEVGERKKDRKEEENEKMGISS